MVEGVVMHGLVRSAMVAPVALAVAGEALAPEMDRAGHRLLGDAAGHAAGAERQDGFRALFWAWSAGLFVVVGFFRRRALTDLVNHIKEKADGQK